MQIQGYSSTEKFWARACVQVIISRILNFFGRDRQTGKTGDNHHIARHSILLFHVFLFAGILFPAALAVLELARPAPDPASSEALLKHWLVILAAILPAMAASVAFSAERRACEPHCRSYRVMSALFGLALDEANALPAANRAGFQELMHDLGREALAENAAWLLDHRHRPIKHQ